MYATGYVFSKSFFTGWIIIGIVWMFMSFIFVGIYPIFEGRHSILSVCKQICSHLLVKCRTDNDTFQSNGEIKMTDANPSKNVPNLYI